jgi:predicted amino acid racemase
MRTPRIQIDLKKIAHNARTLSNLYAARGIRVTGVTKGVCGDPTIARIFLENGVVTLADSRIPNIAAMREAGVNATFMLLRLPAISEAGAVVEYCHISLNTEIDVVRKLSDAALAGGVTHKVMLMVELGDLREGIMPRNLKKTAQDVLALQGVELAGIGTSLACLGGVLPDGKNMSELSAIASDLEAALDITLKCVSVGNSSVYSWIEHATDAGRINDVRLGESILLGGKDLDCKGIPGLHCDAFTVVAEVLESKVKPSLPYGTQSVDAFGNVPAFTDRGDIRRAILGLGRQDMYIPGLFPKRHIEILGASSDHLIVDAKEADLAPGDEVEFDVDYGGMLAAMTSPYVSKVFVNGQDTWYSRAPCVLPCHRGDPGESSSGFGNGEKAERRETAY